MKQYVLAYAHPKTNLEWRDVLLIEKIKPAWQKGRFNLPGGSIEEGETIHEAARRELLEETNVNCDLEDVHFMGTIHAQDCVVYVCRCDYDLLVNFPETMTAERVFLMPLKEALQHESLIENLRLIIPFCRAGLVGWHLCSQGNGFFTITDEKEHEKANLPESLFFGPVG